MENQTKLHLKFFNIIVFDRSEISLFALRAPSKRKGTVIEGLAVSLAYSCNKYSLSLKHL
jgi:hypothetical protein